MTEIVYLGLRRAWVLLVCVEGGGKLNWMVVGTYCMKLCGETFVN